MPGKSPVREQHPQPGRHLRFAVLSLPLLAGLSGEDVRMGTHLSGGRGAWFAGGSRGEDMP